MLKSYTECKKTKQKTALVSAVCCCYNKGQWNWQFSMLLCVVNVGSACLTQVCETVARTLVPRITLMRNDSAVLLHSLVWSNWNAALWAGFPGLKGAVLYNEGALYVYFTGSWAPPRFELLNYSLFFFFYIFSHCILEMLTTFFFHSYKSHVFPSFPYERFVLLSILPCIFLPITCIGKAHSTVYRTSQHFFYYYWPSLLTVPCVVKVILFYCIV